MARGATSPQGAQAVRMGQRAVRAPAARCASARTFAGVNEYSLSFHFDKHGAYRSPICHHQRYFCLHSFMLACVCRGYAGELASSACYER